MSVILWEGGENVLCFLPEWSRSLGKSSTREISSQIQIEDGTKVSLFIGIVGRFIACCFLQCWCVHPC